MYKVNLTFMEELVRIIVEDEDGTEVWKTITMAAPLLALCSLGTDYAVEATVPALPVTVSVKVNTEYLIMTNPADPDRPVMFLKSGLVAAIVKGQRHGTAKQVVERSDTQYGPAEGRDTGTDPRVHPHGHGRLIAVVTGHEGADGQSGPSEAAPL